MFGRKNEGQESIKYLDSYQINGGKTVKIGDRISGKEEQNPGFSNFNGIIKAIYNAGYGVYIKLTNGQDIEADGIKRLQDDVEFKVNGV